VRTLLLSLGLANLLFFGWSQLIDVPPRTVPVAATTPALVLKPAPGAAERGAAGGTAVPGPAIAGGGAARCATLGPLPDRIATDALRTALQARNLAAHEREAQGEVIDGYWVYIDELRDSVARARAIRRLAAAGVRDAAALADAGQVSVGLFSEKSGADKRAAAVRDAGFEPRIETRRHPVNELWLDVTLGTDMPLPAVAAITAGLSLATAPEWATCPAGAGG
jgi:hypothetical protein